MKAEFDISGKRVEGELISKNNRTCYVKYENPDGKMSVIKRHYKRHNVVFVDETIKFVEASVEPIMSCECDHCKDAEKPE